MNCEYPEQSTYQDSRPETDDSSLMGLKKSLPPPHALMTYESLAKIYCVCPISQYPSMLSLPSYGPKFSSDLKLELDSAIPLLDPELANLNLDLQSMTREEVYFELLKGYQYQTLSHFDDKKQRSMPLYKCGVPGCGKILQKLWNLLDHVRMHAGVKPYICKWCGNRFTQKGNLKKHVKQHIRPNVDDRRRYNCRYCSRSYTERYNLKNHMRKCHPDKQGSI
mmetsp:Transcript_33886/g.33415  ORF Transcript_33886/g.33415 Transcript_33886/m.33415 type:complete len:222 (-) Transcript_33886:74-739(-)